MHNDSKMIGGIGVLTILLLVGIVVFGGKSTSNQTDAITVDEGKLKQDYSPRTGPADAKVTLVEFGDFQCPACRTLAPSIKQIETDYADRVQIIFRHFPLPQHNNAERAARSAQAANRQDKFWQMYDLLYERQNAWATSTAPGVVFEDYARELGLNVDQFKKDRDDTTLIDQIRLDKGDGEALGVDSTPTIYINGKQYTDDLRFASIKAAIDQALGQ